MFNNISKIKNMHDGEGAHVGMTEVEHPLPAWMYIIDRQQALPFFCFDYHRNNMHTQICG